jgi:pilus assembly protein CpaF
VSIRKHRKNKDYSWSSIWIDWLEEQAIQKKNILICGATGAGKTTLIAHLLKKISKTERVLILEESREIPVEHPHAVQLEAFHDTSLRMLVKNALRMRPDRIILGECRGAEAFDVIQALNTGHRGSIATIHASNALDSLKRLEALVSLGAPNIPLNTIKNWIGSSIQVVVYLEKEGDKRGIKEILSVQGLEGEQYRIHPKLFEHPLVNRPNVCDFNELFKESFYERRHSP